VLLEKESKMVELGVFLPVLNNGWVISTAAPQYHPSYAMNKAMTLLAEDLGLSFVLSPVKFGGIANRPPGHHRAPWRDDRPHLPGPLRHQPGVRVAAGRIRADGPLARQGIMLIFPECLAGLQAFGERVLPLMRTANE
jgi:hypothetical protein